MTRIVNTHSLNYELIEGKPYTNYNADEEFVHQMSQQYGDILSFEVVSQKGGKVRRDALLKGSFRQEGFSNHIFYVYAFILYEGGAGRAHDDELRTQLTSGTNWSVDLSTIRPATIYRDEQFDLANKECYCIGIYKQDAQCEDVMFVGMPAEVLCRAEVMNINPTSTFQTFGERVREAYLKGVYLHEKDFSASSTYNLLLFKPKYFLWYMKHRDQLHVRDIDKALDLLTSVQQTKLENTDSLQQIYYGAPGTGKSYKVNDITEGESFVRTTFHPDSDYSTFVGAYKPTTKQKEIFVREESHGKSNDQVHTEDRIVYEFVAQAFLKAYEDAWTLYVNAKKEREEPKLQYLVIEEINRGNCAQIFGDLFQLLDRNDSGFSQYYIVADSDIRNYLRRSFGKLQLSDGDKKIINRYYNKKNVAESEWDDVASKILRGEALVLPSNFCILATMNTSDQSLFPIDSAFKRRWDWVYVPIANHSEKKWNIVVGDYTCGWYSFLEKINEQIGATTNSEDKKLGFFFCQADNDVIDAKKFVGKVLFYLWNDVFKDYGFEDEIFKIKGIDNLTFDKFYTGDGSVNIDVASRWLQKLMTRKEKEQKEGESTPNNDVEPTPEQPQEQQGIDVHSD